MPFDLQGIPSQAEVWLVGNVYYIVYFVPNTNPPVPMAWRVPSADERTALGISGADRTLTADQFNNSGALPMGISTEIPNPGPGVHPFDSLVSQYETEVKVKPWLADPEVLALWAGAAIEGRSITPAELQTTEWWQTHNESERRWLSLNASDPTTAEQVISDNRLQVGNLFREAGVDNATDVLVNAVADRWTRGNWSQAYALTQIQALADPFSEGDLDPALQVFRQGLDTTRDREDQVRSLVNRWLGPSYSTGWTQEIIARWAGELRNNPDAETELTEALRGQRMALFPEYENPNLTYEDIAAPWRGVWQQTWGQVPDESDPLFARIVRLNDIEAATQILRREGIKKGNASVVNDALSSVGQAFGGNIRRTENFR